MLAWIDECSYLAHFTTSACLFSSVVLSANERQEGSHIAAAPKTSSNTYLWETYLLPRSPSACDALRPVVSSKQTTRTVLMT